MRLYHVVLLAFIVAIALVVVSVFVVHPAPRELQIGH